MLVLAILLALLGGNEKPAAAAPATAAAPSTASPAAPRSESRTLVGEILSVDVANRKVVVAQGLKASRGTSQGKRTAKPRETLSVHVPYSTPLVRGKKAASLTDVKPRDHAVVRYTVTEQGAQALSLQVAEAAEGVGGS